MLYLNFFYEYNILIWGIRQAMKMDLIEILL